ncbi:MAG: flagellar hook-associated protein FlgL [Gammaproteobacteria bacterium]
MRISTSLINLRAVTRITDQQSALSALQQRISSGRKILSPADDPAGAAQVVRLTQAKTMTEQFQRNGGQANDRLVLEDSVLASVENSLLRIRELTLQANNSSLTNVDRSAIAQEIKARTNELLGLANTRDTNGEYLFSGAQVNKKPFSQQANGSVVYNADQGQRLIQVSAERQVADGDPGLKVFMDVIGGNGTFRVRDNSANSGSGIIDPGSVSNQAAYVADTYTITFVTNAGGNLGYNVVGASSGQIIPPLPQNPVTNAPDFTSEAAITFNGINTSITGIPAVGDTFAITPATRQDIFSIAQNLSAALETTASSDADVAKILNVTTRSILDIDQAFDHITQFRAMIGARLNTLDDQQQVNDAFLIETQATLSEVQDLDLVSAITELQQRSAALQAAQASFVRIQGLSIFDFL